MPSDFTPSPAMVAAVAAPVFGYDIAQDTYDMIEEYLINAVAYLVDPNHADDAKRWAEATMEQAGPIHAGGHDCRTTGCAAVYRIKGGAMTENAIISEPRFGYVEWTEPGTLHRPPMKMRAPSHGAGELPRVAIVGAYAFEDGALRVYNGERWVAPQ